MSSTEINFSTERLLLRGLELSDAEAMFKYRSDPQVYEFQGFNPQMVGDVEKFIQKIAKAPNIQGTWYQLGIVLKEGGELIGDIGIHFIDNLQVEIGYTLSPGHQGRGYATEAVTGVMDYLFGALDKHRITASVDPRNIKSIALLERIGMRKEGHFVKSILLDDGWADDVVYAILREEWDRGE